MKSIMQQAVEFIDTKLDENLGGPFGAVIVKDGEIIAKGVNCVTSSHDPTAHAEVMAIRNACQALGQFSLEGCEIYTTCEPCPMCLSAIYWARLSAIYYAANHADAANAGFDDSYIYQQIAQPIEQRDIPHHQCERELALKVFEKWKDKQDKVMY